MGTCTSEEPRVKLAAAPRRVKQTTPPKQYSVTDAEPTTTENLLLGQAHTGQIANFQAETQMNQADPDAPRITPSSQTRYHQSESGLSSSTASTRATIPQDLSQQRPTMSRTRPAPPPADTKCSSTFFHDVGHHIDMFVDDVKAHFAEYGAWYLAALIIIIVIFILFYNRKKLTACWKSVTCAKKKEDCSTQTPPYGV